MQIDGFTPLKVVRLASIGELGALIRRAADDHLGLIPVGGGTMQYLGLPPSKPGIAVETGALDQVIDYPARDMTITVQAGITIAKLQSTLARENQWLPIDIPDDSTLGGAIAVNTSGPRRYGYGTLRDYVIGISFMTDEGTEAKAGGRVVKNVAGYDLCKLHTGALGTLGIVTQLTLKVRPKPEAAAYLQFTIGDKALSDVLNRLHWSKTRPICIDVLQSANEWQIVVGFEENQDAVRWQRDQLVSQELSESERASLQDLDNLVEARNPSGSVVSFKANLLPSAMPDFLLFARKSLHIDGLHAHAGNGIVHAQLAAGLTLADAGRILNELRQLAVRLQGNLTVMRCPAAWKRELPIWGALRGDLALMRAVKQRLDPRDIFNPGRFVV